MSYPTQVVCGMIASPGDVKEARKAIIKIFHRWNNLHAEKEGITLRSLMWENDATPELKGSAQNVINKQLVEKADFLIAFFNERIGTPTSESISGTVEEIKKCEEKNKPVLLYFGSGKVDRRTAGSEQFQLLASLKEDYDKKGLLGSFKNTEELTNNIQSHLHLVVRKLKDRLDAENAKVAIIKEAVERNHFLKGFVTRLNEFKKLTERCSDRNSAFKRHLAKSFWEHCEGDLDLKKIRNLFFESGSTIAYLSERFIEQCGKNGLQNWKIKTNNILSYLDFVLFQKVDVVLSPYGPPDDIYGATFGSLSGPNVDPPQDETVEFLLSEDTKNDIVEHASELLPLNAPSLILATASGLELREKHKYPGLHVGSYTNMLFKRALFKSLHPIIIFLDEDKISTFSEKGQFKYGKCYPVFESRNVWASVQVSYPLGFCIYMKQPKNLPRLKTELSPGFRERKLDENVFLLTNIEWERSFGRRVDVRW